MGGGGGANGVGREKGPKGVGDMGESKGAPKAGGGETGKKVEFECGGGGGSDPENDSKIKGQIDPKWNRTDPK